MLNFLKKQMVAPSKLFQTLTKSEVTIWDAQTNKTYNFELNYSQSRKYDAAIREGKKTTQAIREALA